MDEEVLKAACLALLDAAAVEHPSGHQGKLAARYLLRTGSGDRIALMFEKAPKTAANLWLPLTHARFLEGIDAPSRVYPASALYQEKEPGPRGYGRHSGLKSMRDLANIDLIRFTIERVTQMEAILERLSGNRS